MTKAEACLFLGIEDPVEAEDAFEDAVFVVRQQLIAGPVLLKTTESRCKRLLTLELAHSVITGKQTGTSHEISENRQLPETVPDFFTAYHQHKSALLQKLASTLNVGTIVFLANELLELERALAAPFSVYPDWTEETVTIGREPDPMPILQLLRKQADAGRKTITELYENKNNLPTELLIVLKRLSLLKNYLYP